MAWYDRYILAQHPSISNRLDIFQEVATYFVDVSLVDSSVDCARLHAERGAHSESEASTKKYRSRQLFHSALRGHRR